MQAKGQHPQQRKLECFAHWQDLLRGCVKATGKKGILGDTGSGILPGVGHPASCSVGEPTAQAPASLEQHIFNCFSEGVSQ